MKNDKGLLSLEASIALTLFIFFVLFLYSFFTVFETRNEIAHVLLATADSMAFDSYEHETISGSDDISMIVGKVLEKVDTKILNNGFIDYSVWEGADSAGLQTAIKERFTSYIEDDSGGTASKPLSADELLSERYHIVGGIDGLDFSGSYIADDKLYITVTYTMEYEFKVPGVDKITFEQSACSKLWK